MAENPPLETAADPLSAPEVSDSEEETLHIDFVEAKIKTILELYSDGKILQVRF
jgi:hypothetical protein